MLSRGANSHSGSTGQDVATDHSGVGGVDGRGFTGWLDQYSSLSEEELAKIFITTEDFKVWCLVRAGLKW